MQPTQLFRQVPQGNVFPFIYAQPMNYKIFPSFGNQVMPNNKIITLNQLFQLFTQMITFTYLKKLGLM